MSETQEKVIKGGGFLVEDIAAEDMLTPEDFTSEHKMIAKTTEEYVKVKFGQSLITWKIMSSISLLTCLKKQESLVF